MIVRPLTPAGARTRLSELLRGSFSAIDDGSSVGSLSRAHKVALRSLRQQGRKVSKEPGPVHESGVAAQSD